MIPIHPFLNTNSVWNEFNESLKQERYKLEKIKYENYIYKQMIYGLTDYMSNSNHYTTHLIIRKNNDIIRELNSKWYEHIQECGIECQISFYFIQQIYKNFIWAGRAAADFSWGNQKFIYYLGGVDGWLMFGNNVVSKENVNVVSGDNILKIYTSALPTAAYRIALYDTNGNLLGITDFNKI